jgi:hypothetical protein
MDEPTVVAKPLLDAIVVEDDQRDGSLADSTGTDESDGSKVFRKTGDLLDQLVPSKEDPRWRWRGFSGYTGCRYLILDSSVVEIANLVHGERLFGDG